MISGGGKRREGIFSTSSTSRWGKKLSDSHVADILTKGNSVKRRSTFKRSGKLSVHFVERTIGAHKRPVRQRFSSLSPCRRNVLHSTGKRDNAADHGTGCIHISETTGGQPERMLVAFQTLSSTTNHEGDGNLCRQAMGASQDVNGPL